MSLDPPHFGLDSELWPGTKIPLSAAESAWLLARGRVSQEELLGQLIAELLIIRVLMVEEGEPGTYPFLPSRLRRFKLVLAPGQAPSEWEQPTAQLLGLWNKAPQLPLHQIALKVSEEFGTLGWKAEIKRNLQNKGYVNGLGMLSSEGRKTRKVLKKRLEAAEFEWTHWEFDQPDRMVRLMVDMGMQLLNVEWFESNVIERIRPRSGEMKEELKNFRDIYDLERLEQHLMFRRESKRGLEESRKRKNS